MILLSRIEIRILICTTWLGLSCAGVVRVQAEQPSSGQSTVFIWPDLAPLETSRSIGEPLPAREGESPPITRVVNVRRPSMEVFPPEGEGNGVGLLILPGGGFSRVVPDLEGSEAAARLNKLGITAFVLYYRTNEALGADEPAWRRPLQDGQRALRWLRANAAKFNLKSDRIGLLGFSAGGQVASILMTSDDRPAYDAIDAVDEQSCRPDFTLLIYPWRVLKADSEELLPEIRITPQTPPAFIVHTGDDASSSLGSVLIYAGLKRNNVPAELHVYENGGHGYGTRQVKDSNIGSWPDRADDWLRRRDLAHE